DVPAKSLTSLDVEHWHVIRQDKTVDEAVLRKLVELIARARQVRPDLTFGYYGIVPRRDYGRAITADRGLYKAWQLENDANAPLVAVVDGVFPSIYTLVQDEAGWRRYASEQIKEARRVAPALRVFPFVWNRLTGKDGP